MWGEFQAMLIGPSIVKISSCDKDPLCRGRLCVSVPVVYHYYSFSVFVGILRHFCTQLVNFNREKKVDS